MLRHWRNKIPLLLGNLTVQPSSFERARGTACQDLHDAGVQLPFKSSNHDSRQLPSETMVLSHMVYLLKRLFRRSV